MFKLLDLYSKNCYDTDKNTIHCYIEKIYDDLFLEKLDATNILEIGTQNGGSILLWRDFFQKAVIDAVDICDCSHKIDNNRINHIIGNAYETEFLKKLQNYDIIIDDGPHTLDSMKFFIQNYLSLLKPCGIAIIEDIQSIDWIDILTGLIPSGFHFFVHDLRNVKNRYDDIVLVIRNR